MYLWNLWNFYAKIVRTISKKNIWKTCGATVFDFCFIIFLEKIGLTVVVLECLEYVFKDISLLIILAKWESVTLADIFTNFAEMPTDPLALFTSSDFIILLNISLVLAYGISNLFLGAHKFFIFRMVGWLLYMEIISLTVISSWDASGQRSFQLV